jgi:hypothetical protein
MDGSKWRHIYFHIFSRKQKRLQNPRNKNESRILSEKDTNRIRYGNGAMQIFNGTKINSLNYAKIKNSSESTNVFPNSSVLLDLLENTGRSNREKPSRIHEEIT